MYMYVYVYMCSCVIFCLPIRVHQVHKETVSKVPNAVPGRDNIELEIFGLEGIPEGDRIAHEHAVHGESILSCVTRVTRPAMR